MLTYTITESGYRIQQNGTDWIIQEGEFASVYPGATMDERAQNHIKELEDIPSDAERIEALESTLNGLTTQLTNYYTTTQEVLPGGEQ